MNPSIYRLRLCDILAACVLALLALGVVMVQSAAMRISEKTGWYLNDAGAKHLLFVALALVTFFAVGRLDFRFLAKNSGWKSPAVWALLIAAAACLVVLLPGVTRPVNGARRWLTLGFTQVQPSELGKWAVVLFLAWWLSNRPVNPNTILGLALTLAPIVAVCLLIVIEDFGTAALIGMCTLTICLAARVNLLRLAVFIPPVAIAAYWFITHKSYRVTRLTAFLDPFASPQREGYHMVQSILSFSSGGLFGTGLGRGVQKLGYLPEDTTDFIFAVICEELGLFGALLVVAIYLGIIYVAVQTIRQKSADTFSQLLAFGVGSMIGLQALINIAVATVSVPPKGMSLPLISAGGSGLVITSAALGLLYSVCRRQEMATSTDKESCPEIETPSPAQSSTDPALPTPQTAL